MNTLIAATAVESSMLAVSLADGAQPVINEARLDRLGEFEDLLPQMLSRLRKFAGQWLDTREDAEDAVQDAMLSAFKNLSRFGGRAKMSTWLTAIVMNAARMQLRARRRARTVSLDWVPEEGQSPISEMIVDSGITPDRALEESERSEIAARLTRGLPRSQRVALQFYQQGVPMRDAAMRLGIPEGTLKAQLARGRARLTKRFHAGIARSAGDAVVRKKNSGAQVLRRECSLSEGRSTI